MSLLSLVAASRAFSLQWLLVLQSMGSRALGPQWLQHGTSAVVVRTLSRSPASGIFPDRGLSLGPMHWQADSEPRDHQESPTTLFSNVQDPLKNHSLHLVGIFLVVFNPEQLSRFRDFCHS